MYYFSRYELLGTIAWHVQQFDVGEQAIRQALAEYPNIGALQDKLHLYVARKKMAKSLIKPKIHPDVLLKMYDSRTFLPTYIPTIYKILFKTSLT